MSGAEKADPSLVMGLGWGLVVGRVMSIYRVCAVAALVVTASVGRANALSADDLMGRWCGDNISSEFTRETLTVKLKSGRQMVLRVKEIAVVDSGRIKVTWDERDGGGATDYIDFTGGHMAMAPQTDGDKGPRRDFHRC